MKTLGASIAWTPEMDAVIREGAGRGLRPIAITAQLRLHKLVEARMTELGVVVSRGIPVRREKEVRPPRKGGRTLYTREMFPDVDWATAKPRAAAAACKIAYCTAKRLIDSAPKPRTYRRHTHADYPGTDWDAPPSEIQRATGMDRNTAVRLQRLWPKELRSRQAEDWVHLLRLDASPYKPHYA